LAGRPLRRGLARSSGQFLEDQRCRGGIAAPLRHADHLQNPDAAIERDRDHVPAFHIAAWRYHPIAVDPDVPCDNKRRGIGSRAYDARVPQPPVNPLPFVARHLCRASAPLLGGRLKLRLEGRELGERRLGVRLLLALAMRGEVATVLVVAAGSLPVLGVIRPFAPATLRTVALAVRTLVRAVFTLALLVAAALFTFAPELALWGAWAALMAAFLFGGRPSLAGRLLLGAAFRFRGGAFRRLASGRRFSVGLMTALPLLLRTPRAASLFAAAARTPHLDELRLCGRRRRDSRLHICRRFLGRVFFA
jgi:hypothetical protein